MVNSMKKLICVVLAAMMVMSAFVFAHAEEKSSLSDFSSRLQGKNTAQTETAEVSSAEDDGVSYGPSVKVVDPFFKKVRVLVFAKGDQAKAAEEAGADYVGAEELVAKIQGENWFDFDVVVATPNMMGVVGRLGRVLGPKGLMPNPKSGTVTMDVAKAIAEIKAGKVEYRLDKQAIIHCPIGKKSFTAEQLVENLNTLIGAINRAKPAAAKGTYMKSLVLHSTMGPGIKVNPLKF